MHHKLQVKFTGCKCWSSPFSVTGQRSSCTSGRANEAWFPIDLCLMSPQNSFTAVPHPWCLQLSLFHGCLFPTGISVQNPLMLLLWLGHAADVLDVLAAWQMCMGLVGAMWWPSSHPAILFHFLCQESQCFWDLYSSAYFVWHSPQKDFLTNKWPVRLHMPCSLRKPG